MELFFIGKYSETKILVFKFSSTSRNEKNVQQNLMVAYVHIEYSTYQFSEELNWIESKVGNKSFI